MSTPKERALYISYVLSQLLIDNIDIVVLEKQDANEPDLGRLKDKLIKLRSATNNAFKVMERNVGDDLVYIKDDIEKVLEDLWN